jgi:hypothetical protein
VTAVRAFQQTTHLGGIAHFAPVNAAALLTRIAKRITKQETFGSANRGEFEASLRREEFLILAGYTGGTGG